MASSSQRVFFCVKKLRVIPDLLAVLSTTLQSIFLLLLFYIVAIFSCFKSISVRYVSDRDNDLIVNENQQLSY